MVREDLIEGAISFLQDPSVAAAPIEQRVAFLRSKNLTQDEIDASLARVGQGPVPSNSQPPQIQYRQQPQQYNNGYSQQQYPQYWQQPPPELPRRDWRDWFIAATVMGGVGYGLYWTAKRYVAPLIAPPTPPQIEQDKAAIDASFEKTFALLEQLATDTQELKDAELARKTRLDTAMVQVETVIEKIKQANDERDLESKRIAREIGEIRDQIPRAIEKEKETTDNRLKDLSIEMKSLKTLVANRMSGGAPPQRTTPSFSTQSAPTPAGLQHHASNSYESVSSAVQPPSNHDTSNGAGVNGTSESYSATNNTSSGSSGSSYNRMLGGKAAIPSWQLAAKKRTEEAKADHANGASGIAESGTVTESTDGA